MDGAGATSEYTATKGKITAELVFFTADHPAWTTPTKVEPPSSPKAATGVTFAHPTLGDLMAKTQKRKAVPGTTEPK